MGITRLRAQRPPLNWSGTRDLILAVGSKIAEVFEVCLPGPAPLEGRVPLPPERDPGLAYRPPITVRAVAPASRE